MSKHPQREHVRVLALNGLTPEAIVHITGLQRSVVDRMRSDLFPHDASVAHGSLPGATQRALDIPNPPHINPRWHGALRAILHKGPRAPWHHGWIQT